MSDPPAATTALYLVKGGGAPFGTDALLVAGVRAQSSGASRALWDRYAPLVTGIVRRALGPEHEADDLAQDVFLRVFRSLHHLREPEALRSFIVSVTMNAVRVELRRRKLRRWLRLTDTGALPEAAGPWDPSPRLALVRFYRILDELGAEERACFVLRHFEGLELPEIAAALALSVATIKRRLSRATERVFRRIQNDAFLHDFMATSPFFREKDPGRDG